MPRFRRSRPEDTVRAAWWDEGETATFKARLTEAQVQEMAILVDPRLAELRARMGSLGLSEQTREDLEQRLTVVGTLYVSLESWTFRTDPTPEQGRRGEPGDVAPLTMEAVAELDTADMAFLLQEMTRRIQRTEVAPSPSGFRPGGATAGAVHPGQRVRGRGGAAGAGAAARGDGDLQDRMDLRAV